MMNYLFLILIMTTHGFARTIVLPRGRISPGKLEINFQEKCLATTPSLPQCQSLAAILTTESISLLSWLEQSSHPETIEAFKLASHSKDETIRAYAMNYLSTKLDTDDEGLIATATKSLFTSNSWLGYIAAHILSRSGSKDHEELGKTFLYLQDASRFENSNMYADVLVDEFIQSMTTFFDEAHFANEERFIGMDAPLIPSEDPTRAKLLGGKGFIIPGSLSVNAKAITASTGLLPALSVKEISNKMEVLSVELQDIFDQIQRGDYSQMQQMVALQKEIASLSAQHTLWFTMLPHYLQLDGVVAFFKLAPDRANELEGAIILKEWSFYEGTSIVYLGKW